MSGGRALQQRLRRLGETREILNAMKNLALMETHKLARHRSSQQQVIGLIETVAGDFLTAYPSPAPSSERAGHAMDVHLLIGSERGFCGDFNETLLAGLAKNPEPADKLIVVGNKLGMRLADDARVIAVLDGASIADEVPATLTRLIETISTLQSHTPATAAALTLTLWHHASEAAEAGASDKVIGKPLLPPFRQIRPSDRQLPHPALLNLPPQVFLARLIDQYLFALLHQAFYTSLLVESQRRVNHMDGAVSHLDDTVETLNRKKQSLRQEEITEEIEVLLLSTAGPGQAADSAEFNRPEDSDQARAVPPV